MAPSEATGAPQHKVLFILWSFYNNCMLVFPLRNNIGPPSFGFDASLFQSKAQQHPCVKSGLIYNKYQVVDEREINQTVKLGEMSTKMQSCGISLHEYLCKI